MDLPAEHTPYAYTPLPRGTSNTRLLRLLPAASASASIKCRLIDYSLEPDSHQYDALSYVWGDPENTVPIYIDEFVLYITVNLHAALVRLRDHSLERYIWVDAVCINQADEEEKRYQIQSMARIYGQANRVIVWLGEEEDDSSQALETIRSVAESGLTNVPMNWDAVLALVKRPWFERIWVLQEVAAARHVLIICGSASIDGFAFCLGLDLLGEFGEIREDLPVLVRSVTYLIRGSIFRPKYVTSWSGMDSLDICPLGELIDMYHTHKATYLHDKVYALLGMSSIDGSRDLLSPTNEFPWEKLLQRLVKFLLCKDISVETRPEKEMAVIRSKGCFLARVASVESDNTRNGRQNVRIEFERQPGPWDHNNARYDPWTLNISAKQIQSGDLICLLQGTSKPIVVRPCKDYFSVIQIAADLNTNLTMSANIEWSEHLQSIKVFPRNFLLVWDWAEKSNIQEYEEFLRTNNWSSEHPKTVLQSHLDKLTRIWQSALILDDSKEYQGAEERLGEVIESYEAILGEEHTDALKNEYSQTVVSHIACNSGDVVKPMEMLFQLAARGGHEAVAKLVLETGKADVNLVFQDGQTVLSWAAEGGRLTIIDRLLEAKADVNATGYRGRTALQAAAEGGHLNVVERLLQEKADVNAAAAKWDGRTALQAAAGGGHLDVVERLLQEKADVNAAAVELYGRTALQAAAEGGHLNVVERLLQEKADVNAAAAVISGGRTALQAAAEGGHLDVVERLLQKKADVNAVPSRRWGVTALEAARKRGHTAVKERLRHAGALV